MKIILKRTIAILFVCLSVSTLSYAEDDNKIVIGMSAAFSGPSKNLGYELYNGMMAYFEYINKNGGVDGKNIEVLAYDDGYNPLPAINNTLKLLDEDKIFLLMNYVGTPTVTRVLPILKIFETRDIFLFFPFTGAEPQRTQPYMDYVFNLRASYLQETAWLVANFVDLARPKIAVFYQADAYGRSGWDGVRKALSKYGLNIVGEATYKRGANFSSSYKEQVEILRKDNPDAIISIGSYAACAGFIRDARDAGWDIPIANVSFVGSESMLDLLIAQGRENSKDYTVNLINTEVVPDYTDTSLPAVKQYRELMANYTPKLPPGVESSGNLNSDFVADKYGFVSFEGFLNAKMLVEILKRMNGDIKKSRIKDAVLGIKNYDLGIGETVSFGAGQNQGLNKVYFNTVIDGRYVPIKDWSIFKK